MKRALPFIIVGLLAACADKPEEARAVAAETTCPAMPKAD